MWVGEGFEVGQDYAFKRLHDHRCQGDGPVVIESCDPRFIGDGGDGGGLEAGWYVACLSRKVLLTPEAAGQHNASGWRGTQSPGRLLCGGYVFKTVC